MIGRCSSFAAALLVGHLTVLAGVTPSNDDCASPITVQLGATPFTSEGATTAGPSMCSAFGGDVWFKFKSTFTGNLRVSTCGDANFDTIIAVYSGCSCGSFNQLACNDENTSCPDHTSKLTVPVEAGKCYRIRVAGFNGATGLGVLHLNVVDPQNAGGADRIKSGAAAGDRFGWSVAGNARFDADAFRDVLIGAPRNDTVGANAGRAYAFKGSALSGLYTIDGEVAGDIAGYSVAVCDANDDGRDDLVIGAPSNDEAGVSAGKVYVYSGFDGSLLWSMTGFAAGDRLGWSVAAAGDIDNDGFEDVIVGAPYSDAGGIDAGRAYVLDGQNGAVLRTFTGQNPGDLFGWAVAGIGDANNDGNDDVAVGAPRSDFSGTDAGRVSIYSGSGPLLKRLNGDNPGDLFGSSIAGKRFNAGFIYDMIAVGAPNNDANGNNAGEVKVFLRNISSPACGASLVCLQYTILGGNGGDRFGTSVAVDNVVGNSFADVIVGAPKADLNGSASGAAYVFSGSNGSLATKYFGEAAGDNFGQSVAAAGDVNGDSNGDLLVGAPFNDAGGDTAGRAYVFFLGGSGMALMASPEEDGSQLSVPVNVGRDPIVLPSSGDEAGDHDALIDVNGDGVVNGDDVVQVISAWGPCGDICPADVDHDGDVNVDDLLVVINGWR